jgi:serine/threonine protein kinase
VARSFRGYEIEKKIGAGGMATLYLGMQKALNRHVAIKMLHPGLADDESFISRFEREAKTASSIGHRNIVSVFDFGVEDDVYYIVMELVRGSDMKDLLADAGAFPPEVVLAVLEEVSYGLEAAHKQGVIHRDIKPGNVMLSEDGEVKVADFGLARESSDIARMSSLTLPGSVLGTPAYMSPEQATGKEIDHRTDIYSLGVMAYELLTGEKPFQGASYSEIRDQIINRDPPRVALKAAVTPETESLLSRMMEKDPDRRFPSMRHCIRAIEDCMETLDPTGGLIKYRRKYLTKFAQNPTQFGEELRKSSISAHLDRGFYFKQMGMAKIDDAVREFRYVLAMDPDNSKATSAITELRTQAEESGVRLPEDAAPPATREPSTRRLGPDLEPAERPPVARPAPPVAATPARDASGSSVGSGVSRSSADRSGARDPSATRIFGESSTAPMATQVLSPEESGLRAPRRIGFPGRIVGPAVAVLVVIALLIWRPWAGGGDSGGAGALALRSDPAGASVFLKGPGDADFRPTGQSTPCEIEDLSSGIWEVRLELAGSKPQVRKVPVQDASASLAVTMVPLDAEAHFQLATTPGGATVRLRRPSETAFRTLEGKTPYTSEALDSGRWIVQAELAGTGTVTRPVDLAPGATVEIAWDLVRDADQGRLEVTSEPSGARIRIRPDGSRNWEDTGQRTPATLEKLAVGAWDVEAQQDGYEAATGSGTVARDVVASVALTLRRKQDRPPAPVGDGYARIVASPFADIYLDGRIFATEQRLAVLPLASGKSHDIELRHRTFGTKTFKNVKAAPGDTVDLGRFEFRWGHVRVFCKPPVPADLLIDGSQVDRQTPFSDQISAGTHRFQVRKSGYRVADVTVTAPDGAQTQPSRGAEGEVSVPVPSDGEVRVQFTLEKE